MLLKHTPLFILFSLVVTTTAAPGKTKHGDIVVPNDTAMLLHGKRGTDEDSPLPVLADDGIQWTTDKSARGLGETYNRRRRQIKPTSTKAALQFAPTLPNPTPKPKPPPFLTLCYPPQKDISYATSSMIFDCFATQYVTSNDISFTTPLTTCQDTVCLTMFLPNPPPQDTSSPASPTSLPASDFTTELSAAYARLRDQCDGNWVQFGYTRVALGVTTLKDGADIYAVRVDVWEKGTGEDHSKGGRIAWCS